MNQSEREAKLRTAYDTAQARYEALLPGGTSEVLYLTEQYLGQLEEAEKRRDRARDAWLRFMLESDTRERVQP